MTRTQVVGSSTGTAVESINQVELSIAGSGLGVVTIVVGATYSSGEAGDKSMVKNTNTAGKVVNCHAKS